MSPGEVKVVPARLGDIHIVLGRLYEAASWIIEQKLPSVWKLGGFSRQTFLEQISRVEAHIGLRGEIPARTITLQ